MSDDEEKEEENTDFLQDYDTFKMLYEKKNGIFYQFNKYVIMGILLLFLTQIFNSDMIIRCEATENSGAYSMPGISAVHMAYFGESFQRGKKKYRHFRGTSHQSPQAPVSFLRAVRSSSSSSSRQVRQS